MQLLGPSVITLYIPDQNAFRSHTYGNVVFLDKGNIPFTSKQREFSMPQGLGLLDETIRRDRVEECLC
jgi:hypothetical protein